MQKVSLYAICTAALCLQVACGGGSSSDSGTPLIPVESGGGSSASTTIPPSSLYAQQCSPSNPLAPTASMTGSLTTEKQWIRSYMNEAYLWYSQVPTVDPTLAAYSGSMSVLSPYGVPTPLNNYFQALKTPQTTASGALVDKFSFTYSTSAWNALSQSGQAAGYGAQIALLATTPPRQAIVAYTDPNTPAAAAGITRGAQILQIDGVDLVNDDTQTGVNSLNAGLLPTAGAVHTFVILDQGATASRSVTMTAQVITSTPVQDVETISTSNGTVGYMLFNQHIASAEQLLINAVNQLKSQNISDLVLDLRYNGGGYLYIASELAYMIAGPNATYSGGQSLVYDKLTYNDKRTVDTNNPASTTPFYNASCILNASGNCTNTAALPYLGLKHVYVLAQSGTCSASETIINGLRGVGITVTIIGGTTCGKPYGFTAHDNCGVSYFPIEFKGVNNVGYGDYTDGFTPSCAVADDFTKQLGDSAEGMLAGALTVRATGLCPGGGAVQNYMSRLNASAVKQPMTLVRSPLLENLWRLPGK